MKKTILLLISIALCNSVQAIPTEINYQGTLRLNGALADGPYNFEFQLTSKDGNTAYSDVIQKQQVPVKNGLFSVGLNFVNVDWEKNTPYLKITVNGNVLRDPVPFAATAYAKVSASIIDGAVTRIKLDSDVADKLVPTDMIAMFAKQCPTGWAHLAEMDSKFPMGGNSYGSTGGSSTHTHSISIDGAHDHGGTGGMSIISTRVANTDYQTEEFVQDVGTFSYSKRFTKHNHSIASAGAHNHGGGTGSSSSLPPFLTVVFCKKT